MVAAAAVDNRSNDPTLPTTTINILTPMVMVMLRLMMIMTDAWSSE